MDRALKQVIFGFVYLIILGGIGYGVYDLVRVEPTCFDNIKNGLEEGLDCGVAACGKLCEPEVVELQVKMAQVISTGQGTYDFLAKVSNPNTNYGSSRVEYDIQIQDGQGTTIYINSGNFYILPSQTRYIIKAGLRLDRAPSNIKLMVKNIQWEKVNLADTQVDFSVRNEHYTDNQDKGASYQALLFNNSNFDFDTVDIGIVLIDDAGQVVGVNGTTINSFGAHTERSFSAQWSSKISVLAPHVDVQATTNILENTNFIKSYGSEEKFQKFYEER